MLTLYYAPGSSSMASHLALEDAGAEYEARLVDEEAGEVEVRLEQNPGGGLLLTVRDDGVGLPNRVREGGLGQKLTRAFARKIGATLAISSGKGGTTLALKLPDNAAANPASCRTGQHLGIRAGDGWRLGASPCQSHTQPR